MSKPPGKIPRRRYLGKNRPPLSGAGLSTDLRSGLRSGLLSALLCLASANCAGQAATKDEIKSIAQQYSLGRYVLAENMGRELLRSDPTNIDVHYLMGNIYFKLDDLTAARQQYTYCIEAGRRTKASSAANLAAAALTAINNGAYEKSSTAEANADDKQYETRRQQKQFAALQRLDPASRHHAESILEKADDSLVFKKHQLDIVISHTEEFARSRIKEIPVNTIHRRMSAFTGIEAARDNEDYYVAPNVDRPAEVARIRENETAKVKKLIEQYKSEEQSIIATAMKEVDAIVGCEESRSSQTISKETAPDTCDKAMTTIQALTACGITARHQGGDHRVTIVTTGSAAHHSGLLPGDSIVQSTFIPSADLLKLTLRRDHKNYAITLHPDASSMASANRVRQFSKAAPPAPKLTSTQQAWERIKDSEIIFVQDMSSNMSMPLGETGQAKWDWCASRIVDFADGLSRHNSKQFGLMQAYQNIYHSYKDQSAQSLRQLFNASFAMESAVLSAPIQQLAYDHLNGQTSKPLLIMVFTTGKQERGDSLEVAIKTIVDHMKNPDQARIVFFQIGDDPAGTSTLKFLDEDLAYAGFKYDIVDWVRFEDFQSLGLNRALLDAYERPRHAGMTAVPPKSTTLGERLTRLRTPMAIGTPRGNPG